MSVIKALTLIKNLANLVRRVGARDPAQKVPSPMERGFCDIGHADCPQRAAEDNIQEGRTEDF